MTTTTNEQHLTARQRPADARTDLRVTLAMRRALQIVLLLSHRGTFLTTITITTPPFPFSFSRLRNGYGVWRGPRMGYGRWMQQGYGLGLRIWI